jgi:hypothetical protein
MVQIGQDLSRSIFIAAFETTKRFHCHSELCEESFSFCPGEFSSRSEKKSIALNCFWL